MSGGRAQEAAREAPTHRHRPDTQPRHVPREPPGAGALSIRPTIDITIGRPSYGHTLRHGKCPESANPVQAREIDQATPDTAPKPRYRNTHGQHNNSQQVQRVPSLGHGERAATTIRPQHGHHLYRRQPTADPTATPHVTPRTR